MLASVAETPTDARQFFHICKSTGRIRGPGGRLFLVLFLRLHAVPKKNDQAFVEQKNGAVVRRLVGYGRFDGVETTRVLERLYAASRQQPIAQSAGDTCSAVLQ